MITDSAVPIGTETERSIYFDMAEEDLFCESVIDKSNGYSSGSFGGSGFVHSAGRKRSETNYTFSEGFSDLIDLISPHHEEHITSLWEDKWKFAELSFFLCVNHISFLLFSIL